MQLVMIASVNGNCTAKSSAFEQHHRDNVCSNDMGDESFCLIGNCTAESSAFEKKRNLETRVRFPVAAQVKYFSSRLLWRGVVNQLLGCLEVYLFKEAKSLIRRKRRGLVLQGTFTKYHCLCLCREWDLFKC